MRTAGDFDVAVVGAGPAGAATARRLARAGCAVVLLERSRFEAPRAGESLAPATRPLLEELGVWRQFAALSPLPSYGTRSIWGSPDEHGHSHMAGPYGCGWHVDRPSFDRMLAGAAADAGADLRCGTAGLGCVRLQDGRWQITCVERDRASPVVVRARVLVDATGRAAHLARRLGASRVVIDRLVGVAVSHCEADVSAEGYVLVETTPHGWWYSAPAGGDRMITMLMTDADICRQYGIAAPEPWQEMLGEAPATAARVATGEPRPVVWGPRVFPALSQRLRRTAYDTPWIAAGDAALAVDPISGSGVVRALRSGRAAAETALTLLGGDAYVETHHAVRAYEVARDKERADYLRERADYYAMERRWAAHPFWRRRRPRTGGPGGDPPGP
ncbi:alkylhalidase-like protein [Planotetraspora thailandica]|uniref:Alkylhalidase-like protein n=2 Tax=Planotetraspora thailandica TaxID=487172 RepID=A0A8J3Y145_9ACTN|nr:alkylhalidase-like protein [Planotetraspora thailandica]